MENIVYRCVGDSDLPLQSEILIFRLRVKTICLFQPVKEDSICDLCSLGQVIQLNLFCWESLPLRLRRWSWVSRGVMSAADMAEISETTETDVLQDYEEVKATYAKFAVLDEEPVPIANPLPEPNPVAKAITHTWFIASIPTVDKAEVAEWFLLPKWLCSSVEREIASYSATTHNLQHSAEKFREQLGDGDGTAQQRRSVAAAEAKLAQHLAEPTRNLHFHPKHRRELPEASVRQRRHRGTLQEVSAAHLPLTMDIVKPALGVAATPMRWLMLRECVAQPDEVPEDPHFRLADMLAMYADEDDRGDAASDASSEMDDMVLIKLSTPFANGIN